MTGNGSAAPSHRPVLYAQVLEGLRVKGDGRYLDGTYGRGGHAAGVLAKLGPEGRLLLMDKDPEAIADAAKKFTGDVRVAWRRGSFATLSEWDAVTKGLDGVLFDLGVSSPQLDVAGRGFSFMQDGPLDMRMDPETGESAAEWLARADEQEIASVLWQYGEERMSRRIARAVVARRGDEPLMRTGELAELIASVIGRREPGKHPATRSFQAIRIHINGELDDLTTGLQAAHDALTPGGRLAVISFHSLEDRMVKRFISERSRPPAGNRRLPQMDDFRPSLIEVGKARRGEPKEVADNPRARSAVLRVAERCA